MKKLTIYVADDHTFVRKGMIRLLNTFTRIGTVKEAANGRDLIELAKQAPPDVVILDLEMPVMTGIDTAKFLIEHFPDVKIVVLTMHTEEYFILKLMDIGVHGFLNKSAEPGEVERAIYSVVDKDFYRNDIVNRTLLQGSRKPPSGNPRLSPREVEILLLICQELSPAEISDRLQISEKTFFNHRAHILTKIEGRGNVSIVKYAYQHGLIELDEIALSK